MRGETRVSLYSGMLDFEVAWSAEAQPVEPLADMGGV